MSHAIEFVPISGTIEAVLKGFELAHSRRGEKLAARDRRSLSSIGLILRRQVSIASTLGRSALQS